MGYKFYVFVFIGLCSKLYAQSEIEDKKEKRIIHQIGFQANALIRQLIPFDQNSETTNTNPYLVYYSMSSTKTGWGIRTGGGLTLDKSSNNDGITKRDVDINNWGFRIGVDKQFLLSERWTTGAGLDLLYNTDRQITKTVTESFIKATSEINSNTTQWGGGPMAWIRFAVSKNILLGTEASFYYQTGSNRIITRTTQEGQGFPFVETKTDDFFKISDGGFSLPITLYLLVKF
jgi:hypothetical protein